MRHLLWLAVLLVISLNGCAPIPRNVAFNEADFAPYAAGGTASISGQAFLKTVGGDVKYGAGNTVFLMPHNSYTEETWNRALIRGENITPPDPQAERYTRQTTADGEGRFQFDNLAAGDYYVVCTIIWSVPTGYGLTPTGGYVGALVHLDAGQAEKVVLLPVRQ